MLRKLLLSFGYAGRGIVTCIETERNFRIDIILGIFALYLGYLRQLSAQNLSILFLTIFIVLALEMLNTSIECFVDFVTEEHHELAKITKDLAAGAVGLGAIGALFVGYYLFFYRVDIVQTYSSLIEIPNLICIIVYLIVSLVFIYSPAKTRIERWKEKENGTNNRD